MVKRVPYLYGKVSDKLDELIAKSGKKELDMEYVRRSLPNRMQLTRFDVSQVMKEMRESGSILIVNGKLKRR
jgi:hypothetical protein